MADNAEKIELFCSLTNAPRHVADHYLGAHDWDLDRSISYYFDNPPNNEPGPPSPVAERNEAAGPEQSDAAPQPAVSHPVNHATGMDEDEEFQLALAASLAESGGDAGVPVSHPTRVETMDEDEDLARIGRRPMIPPSIWPDNPGMMLPPGFGQARPEPLIPSQSNVRRPSSGTGEAADLAVRGRPLRSRSSSHQPAGPSTGPSSRPLTTSTSAQRNRVIFDDDDDMDDLHMQPRPPANSHDVDVIEPASSIDLPDGIDVEEAKMLEAAMLGIPYEGAALQRTLRASASNATPMSPGAHERQALRYEQDEAYELSLAADRAKEEAAERARRQAEEAEHKEQEAARVAEQAKQEEERQLKKSLSMKQLRLPDEPDSGDEDAIMIMVRVPDGTRPSRRFSKHDPLHAVFDFIDLHYQGETVKPGSYRLVTQFPRKVFNADTSGTFAEAGLTSRQEALFLEQL